MQVKSLVLVTSLALQCPTLLPSAYRFHGGSKALFLPPLAHAVLHSAALALGHLTASLASYLVGVRRRAVPRGHPLTKGDRSGVLSARAFTLGSTHLGAAKPKTLSHLQCEGFGLDTLSGPFQL